MYVMEKNQPGMDTVTREKRHEIMSHIRGKNSKPEVIVRKYLFAKGLRYRKNYGKLPGHPDIALTKYKTVIFVNGCFWHGHAGCRFFHLPSSNVEFWELKIRNNRERDIKKTEELDALGWTVITIWECEIKRKEERMITLEKVYQDITNRAHINPHQL